MTTDTQPDPDDWVPDDSKALQLTDSGGSVTATFTEHYQRDSNGDMVPANPPIPDTASWEVVAQ